MGKSPLPTKRTEVVVEQMTFAKATHRLLENKFLSRVAWGDPTIYMFLHKESGLLKLFRADIVSDLILCRADFEATDWITV